MELVVSWNEALAYIRVVVEVDFKFLQDGPSVGRFRCVAFDQWVRSEACNLAVEAFRVGYEGGHCLHEFGVHLNVSGFEAVLTERSFELVNIHCLRHVSRKSTWSRMS